MMEIFPMFAVGLGVQKSPEGLPFAREMFTENKEIIKPLLDEHGHSTTLIGHKRSSVVHKNTTNLFYIKGLIYTNAFNYFAGCGYDTTKYDLKIGNLWLNEMKTNSKHKGHSHYGYQISGCFYVDMPKNTGSILFTANDRNMPFIGVDNETYTIFNSKTWRMTPEEGDMYFWRSDILHEVLDAQFDGVRRSIAFDINVVEKE